MKEKDLLELFAAIEHSNLSNFAIFSFLGLAIFISTMAHFLYTMDALDFGFVVASTVMMTIAVMGVVIVFFLPEKFCLATKFRKRLE